MSSKNQNGNKKNFNPVQRLSIVGVSERRKVSSSYDRASLNPMSNSRANPKNESMYQSEVSPKRKPSIYTSGLIR